MNDIEEIDKLLARLQDPNESIKKNAAIDLEKLSKDKRFLEYQVDDTLKTLRDLDIDKGQDLNLGLHDAGAFGEPYTPRGLSLLLMEILYNITVLAIDNKDNIIIDKIREYTEILVKIASDYSPYAKYYDRYLPQIRAVMILYYIDYNGAIDILFKLIEIDEYIDIPHVRSGIEYNHELIDACALLSKKYRNDIKEKLYQLIKDPNNNIKIKAQLILEDLRKFPIEENINVQKRIIEKLKFKNFRGIRKGDIDLGKLTILLGSNNSSKTTILESLFLIPNPLRRIPYYNSDPDVRKEFTAATIIHDVHKTLNSKGFIFLFHNYSAEESTIEWKYSDKDSDYLKFINKNNTIYISTKNKEIFQTNSIKIQNEDINYFGELGIASDTSRGNPSTENENKMITQDALLILPEFTKFAYSYIERNWAMLVNRKIMKEIVKELSDMINDKYIDIFIEPYMGGNLSIFAYSENGVRIRLGDWGTGSQIYIMSRILYEIKKPELLLWDDIESHLNPKMLIRIAEWFYELIEKGVQIVISTHSLEAVKLIAEFNKDAVICLTSLEDGVLKYKKMSIEEVDELLVAGIDIRMSEKVIL